MISYVVLYHLKIDIYVMILISSFLFMLQMNYEDFCHIQSICTEQIGPKCRRFFSPSNFMKFEKDEQGRIAILPFYLYVMRTVGSSIIGLSENFLLYDQSIKVVALTVGFFTKVHKLWLLVVLHRIAANYTFLFRFHLRRPELIWVRLTRTLMASFNHRF